MARFITRVRLKNYKSIASCDVELEPLTFLVGLNGAGKSNFLDAISFVTDALRNSLDYAIRERGGINEVRRRPYSRSFHGIEIRLDFEIPGFLSESLPVSKGHYAFRIIGRAQGGYTISDEECQVMVGDQEYAYRIKGGKVTYFVPPVFPGYPEPPASDDQLYLIKVSGFSVFQAVYDYLSRMGFYNLIPAQIREYRSPDAGDFLERDGSNLSSVLSQMKRNNPPSIERIDDYIAVIVPGITQVRTRNFGAKETLEFSQTTADSKTTRFLAANMSDGTLRAIGILAALFQSYRNGSDTLSYPRLVAIEEPEVALHPAAAGVLRDCLKEATQHTQVLVTSHSPDLLDDNEIPINSIRSVSFLNEGTVIAPIDFSSREVLRERLFTVGELLKMNQLAPDPQVAEKARIERKSLFNLPLTRDVQ